MVGKSPWHPRNFRPSQCVALLLVVILAPSCTGSDPGQPLLTAEMPLHLEEHLDAATITAILEPTFAAIQGGGSLTLFEYVALPGMRRALVRGDEKRRLDAAAAVKDEWVRRHGRGTTPVVRNLPPARVHHLVAPDR